MAGRGVTTMLVAGVAALATAATTGAALAAPATPPASATAQRSPATRTIESAPAAAHAAVDRQVTLPTGDRVRVTVGRDGRPKATVLAARHGQGRDLFQSFRIAGDLYVVPRRAAAAAARNLTSFNVSRLAGLSTPPPPVVRPHFPMQTLTLRGIDSLGRPDTGDEVIVMNVDDMRRYANFAVFNRGTAKVSVPSGHYAAFGTFWDPETFGTRLVTLSQFRVSGDRTVTLDARRATSRVAIRTPKPANPAVLDVMVARSDKRGNTFESDTGVDPQAPLKVQPVTRAPSAGSLHYAVSARMFSPRSAPTRYSYDLLFPTDGAILPDQHYAVANRDLATVRATYTATRSRQLGLDARFGALPWQSFLFAELLPMRAPLQRTEHYTARPDVSWQGDLVTILRPRTFDLIGEYQSTARTFEPGTRTSTVWGNGQPITPALVQGQLFPGLTICPACTNGRNRLYLLAFPFGDRSQHFGFPDWPVKGLRENARYVVSADGVPVAHGRDVLDAVVTLPPGTRRYRIGFHTVRRSAELSLSTDVRTSWSLPKGAMGGPAPSDWYCSDWVMTRTCRVLPLMTSRYALGTDTLGRLRPGHRVGSVTIGHLAGASAVGVTGLTAKVSFDGGDTWVPTTVSSRGSGRYRLAFTVPARARTNGYGAVRITAKDAVGGAFSQTIERAFAVAR